MSCDLFRETLLEFDLDERNRGRVAQSLKHLETCASCREAFRDFDELRDTIALRDRNVEPAEGWAQFDEEITATLSAPRKRLVWQRPAGVAAAILIGVGAFTLGKYLPRAVAPMSTPIGGPIVDRAQIESGSHFTPGDISHAVSAFHQVSQVFDGRAGWVFTSDRASNFGLAGPSVEAAKRLLLLRLTVLSGDHQISEADLMVIPGQTADLKVPLEDGAALQYRIGTSTDEPTHLSLWLEVNTSTGSEPLAALSTNLRLQPGEKVTAGELSTTSGRYVLKVAFARASLPSKGQP